MKTEIMKKIIGKLLLYIILITNLIFCVYPLLWMLINSFKRNNDIFNNPWSIPLKPTFEGYMQAFTQVNVGQLIFNSGFVCVIAGIACLVLSCMVAYGIQRMQWRLNKIVFMIFLAGLMVPVQSVVLPLYTTFVKIGLNDTRWGLILPYIVTSMPYSILILVGFLKTVPREMEESAAIDGCSLPRMFLQITMPLVKPAIATIAIYNFVSMFNELFLALVIEDKQALYTLPVGATMFRGLFATDYTPMFAFLTVTIAISVLVYSIFQKQIVAGLTAGAIKG